MIVLIPLEIIKEIQPEQLPQFVAKCERLQKRIDALCASWVEEKDKLHKTQRRAFLKAYAGFDAASDDLFLRIVSAHWNRLLRHLYVVRAMKQARELYPKTIDE